MISSPTFVAIASIVSIDSFTNTPTFLSLGDNGCAMFAASSGVIERLLGANTNPIKSAPDFSTTLAAGNVVIPHIFTFIYNDLLLSEAVLEMMLMFVGRCLPA